MTFDPKALVLDYGDAAGEARACRASAALFDFSFIAGARVAGQGAPAALRHLTRRRLDDLPVGRIRYAVRTDESGHLVSDLTVWRHDAQTFEVMSGSQQDIADLVSAAPPGLVTPWGDEKAILAVQGPEVLTALSTLFDPQCLVCLPYYGFVSMDVAGVPALVGRVGYTGEQGFEIILPRSASEGVRTALSKRARPAGFAAADILRIEAGFVLFANEFRIPVTPEEAQLASFAGADPVPDAVLRLVSFVAKADFVPILWQPPAGLERPRDPHHIAVTSACFSPHAEAVLGLGYVLASSFDAGVKKIIDPAGSFRDIVPVARSWIDPAKMRARASLRG